MVAKNKVVNSQQVLEFLQKEGCVFIDIRSSDRFNGWPYSSGTRGGHIPNAISLPFKWTKYLDWLDNNGGATAIDECGEIIYKKELDKKLYVCPKCDHHFRIGSNDYLKILYEY